MSTIEIRKITKTFGDFVAVRDADLSVAAGEVVCLLGPSGCGKTTTLRMIAGLERATAGDIIIAGQRMNELPPEKRDIAMVFQFYALYPALTVGENIAMPLHYEEHRQRRRRDRRVDASGGHPASDATFWTACRARSRRARSSASPSPAPSCAIPTASCSTSRCRASTSNCAIPCAARSRRCCPNLSKATVIVTHDQLEALTMADRIAIMRDGMIEQVGTPA